MAENELMKQAEHKPQTFSEFLTFKLNDVNEALPKDFNKTRFVQNFVALINDNPQLQKYGKSQLAACSLKGAYLGCDFFNAECYAVPYGSQLNFQLGYKGAKKICKKYAIRPIKDIYAQLIKEGDTLKHGIKDGEPFLDFVPKELNDGRIVGAFAFVLYQDGGINYDVMTLKELENTRRQSKASNSPAWRNFTGEMYRKTVLHRLCKHIELDFENPVQNGLFRETNDADAPTEAVEVDNPFVDENVIDGEAAEVEQEECNESK